MTDAQREIGQSDMTHGLAEARTYLDQAFAPVPRDPDLRAQWRAALDERLRRIAVKVAPAMAEEQGQAWRDAMLEALSDLPAMIALTAAKRAIHRPFSFLNEVESAIRELAAIVTTERRAALARLDDLEAEIARSRRAALPPQAEGAPLSLDEVRKMPSFLREIGLKTGSITQAEIDAADAGRVEPVSEATLVDALRSPTADGARSKRLREPTEADYAAMDITPEQVRQSHEAAAAEAAARDAPPAPASTLPDGPFARPGDACPDCGTPGIDELNGALFCDGIGCGKAWRPAQAA